MFTPEQQLQYELDNDDAAAAARLQELRKAAASGDINLPRAQRLMAAAFGDVLAYIQAVQESKARGMGGKYRAWLKALPAELLAAMSIRHCISTITQAHGMGKPNKASVQSVARELGRLIELERRLAEAEKVNPLYMQQVQDNLKNSNSTDQRYIRSVYLKAYAAVMKEHTDDMLSSTDCIQIGKFGLDACMQAGLITQDRWYGKGGTIVVLRIADGIESALADYNLKDVAQVVDKGTMLMRCPPLPWEELQGGGYYSPRRQVMYPLMSLLRIRKSERKRLRAAFTAEAMPKVFECANYLQSVPMGLHKPTLDAILRVWRAGGGVLGVPRQNPPEAPPCPMPADWSVSSGTPEEVEAFRDWKHDARKAYEDKGDWTAKVRELRTFLAQSRQMPEDGRVWFPVYFDTRGRWYYKGSPNPQGSDLAKSVLHFAEKRPLGPRGLFWLKVSLATNLGFDKARFVDRAAWTEQHWPAIERALDAPEDAPEVFGDDAPWVAYSTAWELREALRSPVPESYCTGVPVHMDATCSGIQHLSAILRDPVGGKFVNLYDEAFIGPKQDIYGEVATNALKAVWVDLKSDDPETLACARFWHERGAIPRDLAKKPVMTYVYGATLAGTASFVMGYLREQGVTFPPVAEVSKHSLCLYLAKKLFHGIERTVPAAAMLMRWFKGCARQMPKGRRMEWTTPVGFKVQHDYQGFDENRIFLRSCGVVHIMSREYNESTRTVPMQNAISPNFVHAMDASHLTITALKMRDLGHSFVGIHDSFGTHPSAVDDLHRCIREAFVELYADKGILAQFMLDNGIEGSAPMTGELDLARVLSSEFFFC